MMYTVKLTAEQLRLLKQMLLCEGACESVRVEPRPNYLRKLDTIVKKLDKIIKRESK